ncbi:YdbL family protein [Shewanella sp. KX20019]|uniref:YdbL family protein n=1 Tax=Shewanella sp. KX20019 TaxID=2803864 RepID=UPI001925E16D|nr:YdbL family protein [Shewanella sp. KX20019]QQX78477.1 YdbL family protein [Shewanella sp. KX20019]
MKSKILILFASLLLSFNALAISLQDAKAQGFVGEQTNGYLGLVKETSDAKTLVSSINAKRKSHYQKIAKKNSLSISDVAKLAAEKAIKATKKGHYIQTTSGKWVKK